MSTKERIRQVGSSVWTWIGSHRLAALSVVVAVICMVAGALVWGLGRGEASSPVSRQSPSPSISVTPSASASPSSTASPRAEVEESDQGSEPGVVAGNDQSGSSYQQPAPVQKPAPVPVNNPEPAPYNPPVEDDGGYVYEEPTYEDTCPYPVGAGWQDENGQWWGSWSDGVDRPEGDPFTC